MSEDARDRCGWTRGVTSDLEHQFLRLFVASICDVGATYDSTKKGFYLSAWHTLWPLVPLSIRLERPNFQDAGTYQGQHHRIGKVQIALIYSVSSLNRIFPQHYSPAIVLPPDRPLSVTDTLSQVGKLTPELLDIALHTRIIPLQSLLPLMPFPTAQEILYDRLGLGVLLFVLQPLQGGQVSCACIFELGHRELWQLLVG